MIHLNGVTDEPYAFGSRQPLLAGADLDIPVGRYALLSPAPELHRQIVDVLCGLRPPRQGFVKHEGSVSWAIGRQGFIRQGHRPEHDRADLPDVRDRRRCHPRTGGGSGQRSRDPGAAHGTLAAACAQEFSFALALAPAFDVYVIEGAIPFEPCRFTRLWLALFEQRLIGRTLILSSYRQNQLADYCLKGLIYERSALRIEDDLDQCIRNSPRRSRSESGSAGDDVLGGFDEASSASDGGSEIERRRRERQAMVGERRRRRWLNALIVVAPVACALIYALSIATPRYEAESRFFVQSGSGQQGGGAMAASLLTTGNSGGMLGGFVDGWAVSDFLKSRDCMRQLDRKIGLRRSCSTPAWTRSTTCPRIRARMISTAPIAPRSRFPSTRWNRSTCCACALAAGRRNPVARLDRPGGEFVSSMNKRAWPTS